MQRRIGDNQTLQEKISWLRNQANQIRISSLRMVHAAKLGHPGGDLSSADILATLYLAVLRIDRLRPEAPDRDRFIMSKGHCSAALYSTLAAAGILEQSALDTYMKPLSALNGHPDRNKVPGVEANTGPLGHGLPIAVGCAMAGKLDSAAWRVFVLTGDGELQEGSNWEAAMAAAHYKLDNLTLIVDRNGIQQGDFTESTIHLEPLADKWRSFGWNVRDVDGHDPGALLACFGNLPAAPGMPTCAIAHTEKGHGVSFARNRPEWHHHVPTAAELEAAIRELEEHAS
ncbi:MAG: transketolase [Candidatus Acidiferrales bacterium]